MTDRLPADVMRKGTLQRGRDRLNADGRSLHSAFSRHGPELIPIRQIQKCSALHARRYRLTYDDQCDLEQDLRLLALTLNIAQPTLEHGDSPERQPVSQTTLAAIELRAARLARNYADRRKRLRQQQISTDDEGNASLLQLPDPRPSPLETALRNHVRCALFATIAFLGHLPQ